MTFDIHKIIKKILIYDSFYGSFLLGVNKILSSKINTASVSPNGVHIDMMFNPSFMNSLTEDEQIGVVIHELLHIVKFDLMKWDLFANKYVGNIALDICNNQYIDPKFRCEIMWLPDSPEIAHLDLPKFASSKEYYDILMENQDSIPSICLYNDLHSEWGKLDHNLLPIIESQITSQIVSTYENYCNKNIGNVPNHLRNFISEIYSKQNTPIPWNSIVRSFRSFCDKQKVRLANNRPNKRFPDHKAVSNFRKNKLMIGIDTSGSIDDHMLAVFFAEIYLAYKTGAEILVVECDTEIGRSYVFQGKHHNLGDITGGGGTCLSPIVEFYNKSDYNGLIVFTDGFLFDRWAKYSKPILWLVTNTSQVGKINFPGKQILFNI